MGQASIMMTLAVAGMGVLWYGLETGQIGNPPPPEAVAEAVGVVIPGAEQPSLQAMAEKALIEAAIKAATE